MSNFETLIFENRDGVGLLTINRESKLNALNGQVIEELSQCLDQIAALKLKALILTGSGEKSFIAGADISAMSTMTVDQGAEFARKGQSLTLKLENLSCPTIAAVNGFALGGGLEMALSCDFIFASSNAVFALPEVGLGLIPGFGGTQRLAKVIGRNQAKYLVYTGEKIDANRAQQLGLALKVFSSKTELLDGCFEAAGKMQRNSPLAISCAKKVINQGVDLSNEQGLELEAQQFGQLFDSFDMKEGTSAFNEKRKPQFKGE